MTKRIISILIAIAMLFGMAACTKKNGGNNNNNNNTTGSGINTPVSSQPGIGSSTQGAISTQGGVEVDPSPGAAAHVVLDSYPFDDTIEEKLWRWANRAAEHNIALFGSGWGDVAYYVDEIRSLDLGFAGGAEVQKYVELYEVVVEYYPEDIDPYDSSFPWEKTEYGAIVPDWSDVSEAWKYFAVYVRTEPSDETLDGELSRTVLAGYFSESDCDYIHLESAEKGMPDKYYSTASYAAEQGDVILDYDTEYGMNQFGPYVPAYKECCIFFEGCDKPFGPGLKDDFRGVYGVEVFNEGHILLMDGYQPADAWYDATAYPGIECIVYFDGASGSNTIYSIDTDRNDASTYRGLRIGESESRLIELYPDAIKNGDIPTLFDEEEGVDYYWLKQDFESPYGPILVLTVREGVLEAISGYDLFD